MDSIWAKGWLVTALVTLLPAAPAAAVEVRGCAETAGQFISAQGTVEFREGSDWRRAELGQELCDRDSIRTGANSRAAVRLADDAVLRLDENTTLVLADVAPAPDEPSLLDLVFGAIQSFSRNPQTLEVDTPYINATIEGTEFALRVTDTQTALTVIEGNVLASNALGAVQVASGGGAVAERGTAPRSVLVANPADAVSWGLYYPPAVSLDATAADPALAEAAGLAAENRPDAAIARLEAVRAPSEAVRLYHAGLLLAVGRDAEAAVLLDAMLAADPGNGAALAQSAVIDVVHNDREAALDKAGRAVEAAPDAAAPYLALSLAQQASFRLEDARDTLLEGTARVPDSPMLWARLSEIWLTLGYQGRSTEAADRALALDPMLERAHVMRGFAALTEFRTADAAASFRTAIELDQADPLPRFGLGLALIRDGELEAGRGEIDAAVALDSRRSLLRSYLGKAYFEENRDGLAAEQFALAKELDPQDPTPYLYEAIRLQTGNRPGEALGELQKSIELNDNRAPYRSRQQLDQDAAARGASLGRIYDDLGFIELGKREATSSMALDPTNAAAHRFLSDLYRGERRREIARVSELTRSQLLQDLGLNPVQPSLTAVNLNLVSAGGPANAGFNEYNSLFQGDGIRVTGSGIFGNDDTYGGEVAFAGQHGNAAVSVGAFEFWSDGFRPNFDVRHQIYDVFAQFNVSPKLSFQAEINYRKTENGDLNFNFDPSDFNPTLRETLEDGFLRVGARFQPNPHNTTLLSFIGSDFSRTQNFLFSDPFYANLEESGKSYLGEFQHIYQRDFFNLIGGVSISRSPLTTEVSFLVDNTTPLPGFGGKIDFNQTANRIYGYGSVELPWDVTLTAGLSYDNFDTSGFELFKLNPKGGVEWRPIDNLLLRGFYAASVKSAIATNRIIEPTTVAGFNQFFDDTPGTRARRWGFGIDYAITDRIFVGGEATWRRVEEPFFDEFGEASFSKNKEQTHRAYVNTLFHPRVPASIEFVYDKFEAPVNTLTTTPLSPYPTDLETYSVPVTVRYFDPSGFFAGIKGTYVHQKVERDAATGFAQGTSDFFLVDLSAGYRFPNRQGSVSLDVKNLTDQNFRYQDDGFREFGTEPSTGPYFPGISVLGRLTVNF